MNLILISDDLNLVEYYKEFLTPFNVKIIHKTDVTVNLLFQNNLITTKDIVVIDKKQDMEYSSESKFKKPYMLLKGPFLSSERELLANNLYVLRSYPGTPEEILEMIGEI